jgi:predicted transcriptional regulator
MYKAFLNYAQLKEYLTFLTDNGLLSYDLGTQTFKTTQKALRFLKAYGQLDQLTKE